MSRPKPNILLEYVEKTTYKAEQVLQAEGIWAVFYKGKPINLRTLSTAVGYPGPKYRKNSFPNPGGAFTLAKKMNALFKTNDFTVVLLSNGTTVTKE